MRRIVGRRVHSKSERARFSRPRADCAALRDARAVELTWVCFTRSTRARERPIGHVEKEELSRVVCDIEVRACHARSRLACDWQTRDACTHCVRNFESQSSCELLGAAASRYPWRRSEGDPDSPRGPPRDGKDVAKLALTASPKSGPNTPLAHVRAPDGESIGFARLRAQYRDRFEGELLRPARLTGSIATVTADWFHYWNTAPLSLPQVLTGAFGSANRSLTVLANIGASDVQVTCGTVDAPVTLTRGRDVVNVVARSGRVTLGAGNAAVFDSTFDSCDVAPLAP